MITAIIGEVTLQLHQQIQYRIPNTNKISDAKIEELRAAPAPCSDSIWANVIDIGSGEKEWISLNNWKELYDAGAFTKIEPNGSAESQADDLPF